MTDGPPIPGKPWHPTYTERGDTVGEVACGLFTSRPGDPTRRAELLDALQAALDLLSELHGDMARTYLRREPVSHEASARAHGQRALLHRQLSRAEAEAGRLRGLLSEL